MDEGCGLQSVSLPLGFHEICGRAAEFAVDAGREGVERLSIPVGPGEKQLSGFGNSRIHQWDRRLMISRKKAAFRVTVSAAIFRV